MTITYTRIKPTVEGNQRVVYGKVATTSSEGTLYIQTGLRICDNFNPTFYSTSGNHVLRIYPTALPDRVDASGFITIVKASASDTLEYRAAGRF